MDNPRVRQVNDFFVLSRGAGDKAPLSRTIGLYTEWEDGRWQVEIPGYPPFLGTKADGNKDLICALFHIHDREPAASAS